MSSLLFLIPVALALGLVGLIAFMWALRSGQFDDLDGAASRILFDDEAGFNDAPADRSPAPRETRASDLPFNGGSHVGHG